MRNGEVSEFGGLSAVSVYIRKLHYEFQITQTIIINPMNETHISLVESNKIRLPREMAR